MNEIVKTARPIRAASTKTPPLQRDVRCVIHGIDAATVKRLSTPDSNDVTCRIRLSDRPAEPVRRLPFSRTIARQQAVAEEAARTAAAAQTLARQLQPGLRPPPGRLFAVDVAGLVLQGPLGGIGTTERMVCTLAPLAAGGRHAAAVLMAAGGWQDEAPLREALAGLAPKLAAIGLRICRRKAGLRMRKDLKSLPSD